MKGNEKDWSDWGLLFRFLIIICRLLDKEKPKKGKRKVSAWSIFVGEQLKMGRTIKEAAEIWKKSKIK